MIMEFGLFGSQLKAEKEKRANKINMARNKDEKGKYNIIFWRYGSTETFMPFGFWIANS